MESEKSKNDIQTRQKNGKKILKISLSCVAGLVVVCIISFLIGFLLIRFSIKDNITNAGNSESNLFNQSIKIEEMAKLGKGSINDLKFSPDSSHIAVGGSDGIHLYDSESLELIRRFDYFGEITQIEFSPNGNFIGAKRKFNSELFLFNTSNGKKIAEHKHGNIEIFVVSDDGNVLVASCGTGEVEVFDVLNQTTLLSLDGDSHKHIYAAFSPQVDKLAIATKEGSIDIWDINKLEKIQRLETQIDSSRAIDWLFFSPDGNGFVLVTSLGSKHNIVIWDLLSGEKISDYNLSERFSRFEISWGEKFVTLTYDDEVQIRDFFTGELLNSFEVSRWFVKAVSIDSSGSRAISGDIFGNITILDAVSGKIIDQIEGHLDAGARSLAFSVDGQYLAVGHAQNHFGDILLWDINSKEVYKNFDIDERIWSLDFSPDGKYFAAGGSTGRIYIWDTSDWKLINIIEGHNSSIITLAFSNDSEKLISGGLEVHLWDFKQGQLLKTFNTSAKDVAFLPDDESLLIAPYEKSDIFLYDVLSGELIRTISNKYYANDIEVSSDGKYLIVGGGVNSKIDFYEVSSGNLLRTENEVGPFDVSLSFSSEIDSLLAVAFGTRIYFFDSNNQKQIQNYFTVENFGLITSLEFSPTNNILASGMDDGTILLWHISIE